MRGLLAATAVAGVLAIGGLPALALTLAADETAPQDAAVTEQSGRPGPPAWANGRARGHDKEGKKPKRERGPAADDDAREDKGTPGWARKDTQVPPGWARNHDGREPHGWAVREWARCLGEAAAELDEGEKLDPQAACGERPEPPRRDGR